MEQSQLPAASPGKIQAKPTYDLVRKKYDWSYTNPSDTYEKVYKKLDKNNTYITIFSYYQKEIFDKFVEDGDINVIWMSKPAVNTNHRRDFRTIWTNDNNPTRVPLTGPESGVGRNIVVVWELK